MSLPQIMLIGKITHVLFLSSLLFADAIFLGLNQEQIVVAIVATISGSFILTYFRKSLSRSDRIIKIVSSALGGMILGTAIITYLKIETIQIQGAAWFLTSFVVLILLRALLSVTDSNAKGIVTTILRSFIKVDNQVVERKTKVITTEASNKELAVAHGEQVDKNLAQQENNKEN